MEHIEIDLNDIFSDMILKKDLTENERICPVCKGTGVVKTNQKYGLTDDESELAKKELFPYNNETLSFCPNCFNGVIRICKYCGKQIPKPYINKCDCSTYIQLQEEKKKSEYQKTIEKAKKVKYTKDIDCFYDDKNNVFFYEIDDFCDYYYNLYLDDNENLSFNEFFNQNMPNQLWVCEKSKIKLDAESIIESACEDLHDDAYSCIDDINDLQNYLDEWCNKQSGTITFFPCYKEYVEVERNWFDD